jgi:hypothetical protein
MFAAGSVLPSKYSENDTEIARLVKINGSPKTSFSFESSLLPIVIITWSSGTESGPKHGVVPETSISVFSWPSGQ